MKHLKTYKIFEENAFGPGDQVLILYKVPGTDSRELIPVKIIKKENGSNSYLVSFHVENNPLKNHADMVVKGSKIIGPYSQLKEPINPDYLSQQPVGTDYNAPAHGGQGGVSNDLVLPNS